MQENNASLYQSLSSTKGDMKNLVTSTAKSLGLSEELMYSIGMVESNLQPSAKAGTSSATGLYQFTKGTWNEMLSKYGAEYGLPANADRKDPIANALMAGAYVKQNAESYKAQFNQEATPTAIYLGHFLGETGRRKFMEALRNDPKTPVANVVSKRQLKANMKTLGGGATVEDVYNLYANKMNLHIDKAGSTESRPDMVMDAIAGQVVNNMMREGGSTVPEEGVPQLLQPSPSGTPSKFKELGLSGGDGSASAAYDGAGVIDMQGWLKSEEEQDSLFKGTWDSVKAEARLSQIGRWANDKLYDSGISEVDSSISFVREAFGDDPYVMEETGRLGLPMKTLNITDSVYEQVAKTGLDEKWYPYLQTAMTPEQFMNRLDQALNMQKADKAREDAGIGASVVGGLVGALGDPTTYMGGGAVKHGVTGIKSVFLAGTAAAAGAVAAEADLELDTKGAVEGKYLESAAAAFTLGSAFKIAGDKVGDIMANRLKARQESISAGVDDITKTAPTTGNHADFTPHPTEEGAVVLGDGTVMSANNPLNPLTRQKALEVSKAGKHIPLGGLTEINLRVLGSEDSEVRTIGLGLMRSSVGLEEGGSGLPKLVAEDIISMMEGRDFAIYRDLEKSLNKATDSGFFGLNKGSDSWEKAQRQIVEAIESGDMSKLGEDAKAVVALVNRNMKEKFEAATNPAKFGEANALPVFETGRQWDKYFPQVYEEGKFNALITRFGSANGLQDAIKRNFHDQVANDVDGIVSKLRNYFKETLDTESANATAAGKTMDVEARFKELTDEYIEKKSYGIAHQRDQVHASGMDGTGSADIKTGAVNTDFTKERNLFNSQHQIQMDDGIGFAMNDMRHFDIMNTLQMYNRRLNGDIAIHGATGESTEALSQRIAKVGDRKGRRDLEQVMKIMLGASRTGEPTGTLDMLAKASADFAFGSKGALMWTNQLGELAGYMTNRIMKVAEGGIPAVRNMFNPQAKFSRSDLNSFRTGLFGTELNTSLQGSFRGYANALKDQGVNPVTANVVAGVRRGAQLYAQKSPFTQLLTRSTEMMVNMARGGVLGDIADEALSGGVKFRKSLLDNASITEDQYKGILDMFRKHIKVDKDGFYKPNVEAIKADPRSNDLWRLADYVASDTVFRTNKVGNNYASQPNALLGVALQFKTFALKGMNGKFVRMLNEAGNGRAVDHALQATLAVPLAGAIYAMRAHYVAQGMPENKRQAYLDKALDPVTLGYNALSRSSVLGPMAGTMSFAGTAITGEDIFKIGRTTVDPSSVAATRSIKSGAQGARERQSEWGNRVADLVPAVGPVSAFEGLVTEGAKTLTSDYGYESASHGKAFFELLGSVVPNDPIVQRMVNELAEQHGVLDTYK